MKVFKGDTLEVAFVGELDGNLYTVDFSKESTFYATCLMAKSDKGWLWHRRLAHVSMRNLQDLLKGNHILGLTNVSFEKDHVCTACIAGININKSTHPTISCLLQGLWSSFMWIFLGLLHGIVLVEKSMGLSLLMISQDIHRCFSSNPRTR